MQRSGIEEYPGLIRIADVSLKAVTEIAYGVKDRQFLGPDWLSSVRFDITAKPPTGEPCPGTPFGTISVRKIATKHLATTRG